MTETDSEVGAQFVERINNTTSLAGAQRDTDTLIPTASNAENASDLLLSPLQSCSGTITVYNIRVLYCIFSSF